MITTAASTTTQQTVSTNPTWLANRYKKHRQLKYRTADVFILTTRTTTYEKIGIFHSTEILSPKYEKRDRKSPSKINLF